MVKGIGSLILLTTILMSEGFADTSDLTLKGSVPINVNREQTVEHKLNGLNNPRAGKLVIKVKWLCEKLKFYDVRGQIQVSGCPKALRELEAAGHFVLPKSTAVIRR